MEFKVHELKTDPANYNDIVEGLKASTIRVNDRSFQEGDYVVLRKTKFTGEQMAGKDNYPLVYTGGALMCKITHIHSGKGMDNFYVCLSLGIVDRWPGGVKVA